MAHRWILLVVGVVLAQAAAGGEKPLPADRAFDLREISVLSEGWLPPGMMLTRGQSVQCATEPDKEVRAYPKLKSKRPLYGKVKFDSYPGKKDGIEYHFVLDESGESAAGTEKENRKVDNKETKKPTKSSLLTALAEALGDREKAKPAEPQKKPALSSYDRLHFDFNHDLDLTNDRPLVPMHDPPWQALPPWPAKEKQVFETMALDFDYGPGIGKRPFRILPWLMIENEGGRRYSGLFFVAVAARRGKIEIGKRTYTAVLGQPHLVTGRFDRPFTGLSLTPLFPEEETEYLGFDGEMLSTMRRVDGQLYALSTTPTGDKLFVKPYRGDYGVLELGPGGRDIREMSMMGSIRSATTAIGVGNTPLRRPAEQKSQKTSKASVPVGDYLPSYMSLEFGRLQIAISDNYHADGQPRAADRTRTYGFKIRKDKPFVLDFSNKPQILFASPARGQTVKPGDEVSVKAVLVDPVLDVMIRRLSDTKRKQKESYKLPNGVEQSYERPLSLDPRVTVTDAKGKTVAEGKMPFG